MVILYQGCSSHLDSSKNMAARGRGLFSPYIYVENFKNLLVRNHWTYFHIILLECCFGDPLPRLFKPFGFVKKMAARGRGLFSLYIYIENFKNLLVRNHWTNFHILLHNCSVGDSLPRLFKPFGFVKKHGHQGAGLIFPIYLIENLKNLLVRNHWTDFHIILQKCSFGDSLPRLFKPFGFVKKHGRQGAGLIFPIYQIENLKNLLVRNHWTNCYIILQKYSFGDSVPRLFKPFGFVKKHGRQWGEANFPYISLWKT